MACLTRRLIRFSSVLCALQFFAVAALAEAPEREEVQAEAKSRLRDAVKAYESGKYKDAVDLFLAANRLVPSPALSFNTAKAYEKLGDVANALSFYRDYLRRAPDAPDRADIEKRVKRLEGRLRDKGVQQVTVISEPAGATVVLNGEPVGVTPWTGEITPGEHALSVKLEGYVEATQQFTLAAERATDLEVTLEALPPAPPVSPSVPVKSAEAPLAGQVPGEETRASGRPVISAATWVAFGIGVGALGGALGFELARRSSEDEARNDATQVGALDSYQNMEDQQRAARIFVGVGAAAVLTGAILLYFDLSSRAKLRDVARGHQGPRRRIALSCARTNCTLAASGSF